MKAIAISEVGGPERLELVHFPVPYPGSDEVLVRIEAAGVNEVDTLLREGYADSGARPLVMGSDFSGVIELVGADVRDLDVGDEVYGYKLLGNGTYAEFVALPAAWVAHRPTTISHEEAASLPCVGLTAYQGLVETPRPGARGNGRRDRRRGRGRLRRSAAGRRTWRASGPRRSSTTRPATGSRPSAHCTPMASTRCRPVAVARRSAARPMSCATGVASSG